MYLGEEQISETVITDVYKDPLDACMEGIEDLATGILRTGKLVINGEPGGWSMGNNASMTIWGWVERKTTTVSIGLSSMVAVGGGIVV